MEPHDERLTCNQPSYRGGGRIASDAYRLSLAQCDEFAGLEEGANRYGLLLLVKRVGKLAGFTPRMICLLDYYLAYTRDSDWERGSRPIVFQSLARTALDLGVSERQVQKLEAALFHAGAITWNDSGNHKRYGQRDPETGRLLYAFGVDLTPLAYLRGELEAKLHEKKLYDDAWMETKRRLSWLRRQAKGLLAELGREEGAGSVSLSARQARYDEIAVPIRTHQTLETLRAMLVDHEALHDELLAEVRPEPIAPEPANKLVETSEKTSKGSCRDEPKVAHNKYTTHQFIENCSPVDTRYQESVAEPPVPKPPASSSGLEHVTLGMALGAASERLATYLPPEAGWADLVEAAYRHRPELGVSQVSWGDACGVLGRNGAAVALLVTDRASLRQIEPVRRPAAYFRGLVRRAERGELRLHASLFGLLG